MDALNRAFRDIAAGHTRATLLARTGYIRHLSYTDQCDLDERRQGFHDDARSSGVPTEAERLDELKRAGQWSDTKERELARARTYIGELEAGKRKNANMPSMVAGYVKRIDEAKTDYATKLAAKRELLGLTCESHADHCVNDHYVFANLFADPGLTRPLFSEGEFDYLDAAEMNRLVADYNAAMDTLSERSIKRLAMDPFFQRFFRLCGDNLTTLFGKPICALTFFQVDLIQWGGHFRHIYTTHDVSQWKPEVLADPDLLIDYATAVTQGKEQMTKQGAYEEGAIVVGAKKEDAKALGLKTLNPAREITEKFGGNITEWAAKR